jgi:hypothetical protein
MVLRIGFRLGIVSRASLMLMISSEARAVSRVARNAERSSLDLAMILFVHSARVIDR